MGLAGNVNTASAQESLKEVNACRAKRGLRPFIFDANLTLAAKHVAKYRAKHNISGHIGGNLSDFHFVPQYSNGKKVYNLSSLAAGCGCWNVNEGWGTCCMYDTKYRYAGAYAEVKNGKRFMHIFVRR